MLSKLLKYEMSFVWRKLYPIYIALVGCLLIEFISNRTIALSGVSDLATFASFFVVLGLIIYTLVLAIQRFNQGLLKDEGYLYFTMPTKMSTHIWTKVISGAIWCTISVLVTFSEMFFMYGIQAEGFSFSLNFGAWSVTPAQTGQIILFILEMLLILFVGFGSFLAFIYACTVLGNLFEKRKSLWSVLYFLAFYLVIQVMFQTVFRLMPDPLMITEQSGFAAGQLAILIVLAVELVIGAIFFAITNKVLTDKLNLE